MNDLFWQRRTLLKGVGTALALPWLESLVPASLRAAEAAAGPPRRMAFVFFPNGAIMDAWRPQGEGRDYRLGPTMEALVPLKSDLILFSGLAQDNGRAKGDGPGDHARSASTFLTGAHPVKTAGSNIRVGVSADQAAAAQIGDRTKLPSLELGIERGRTAGSCDSGYSCAYSSCISWKTATTPMAKEIDPKLVFDRLFGSATDAERGRAERDLYRQSILDLVAEDAQRLKGQLGQTDRRKVDEYFTSVRELEQRIERARHESAKARPELAVPDRVPPDLREHVRLMFDLLVLAFQTDTTRIATFMLANEGSNRSYRMVDVNSGHHELSHHRNDEDKVAALARIDKFLVGEFAYFLERMKTVREGQGTLLDQSMIVYGGSLSDGNRHRHDDLPIILAGRGGGTIVTGRHIRYKEETPLNNLFVSMLDRMGAPVEQLGDSTGPLKELES
jgi:hypothetical protein